MKKRIKKTQKNKFPYIIHACPEPPGFPTHTHGLTKVGMPEFLIDPLAFGPKENAGLINRAYEYFIKPQNANTLQAIWGGKTLKLTRKDLCPKSDTSDPLIYCFREVPPTFEAVNQAYLIKECGTDVSGMRFVQVYVDGDDFALTDDYYRGGVKW
jgi:hypothetical protein